MAEAACAEVPAPLHRDIPDEIVVWEILVRLPPKALLRCRAVCPAWRHATSTRDFLLSHHGRQPTLPLLSAYDYGLDGHGGRSTTIDIIPFDHRAGLTAVDKLLQSSIARLGFKTFRIEASCDGLLVLSIGATRLCICNPATCQYAPLPLLHGFIVAGMYPHPPTGELRLLACDELRNGFEYACHVFTIGSDQPPRRLGWKMIYGRVSLLLHGSLYLCRAQTIMVFDTIAESFREMHTPVVYDDARLFEIGGMLGLSSLNDRATAIHIWVMQDNERDVWALKHQVELPVAELSAQFGDFYKRSCVVVPSGDGDMLALVRFGEWLLQIDNNGKLVASFHRRGLGASDVRLKQTLVPHTFFPALEGYVVDASPFMKPF